MANKFCRREIKNDRLAVIALNFVKYVHDRYGVDKLSERSCVTYRVLHFANHFDIYFNFI